MMQTRMQSLAETVTNTVVGRQFIGIELNEAYKPLQDERLRQPSFILE